MTTRILPPAEWPKLAGTEAETLWPTLDPEHARIVVVEREGEIVGCHVLFMVMHAECLWVHPDLRGKGVARQLWDAVQVEARSVGARGLITGAATDHVRNIMTHIGGSKMPVEQWMVPIAPLLTAEEEADRCIGAVFHARLEQQLTAENHPDDARHDIAVGRALRLGIDEGRVAEAVDGYNAWASSAGYVPIRHIETREGPEWVLDMGTAVIAVRADYHVAVLEERTLCQS